MVKLESKNRISKMKFFDCPSNEIIAFENDPEIKQPTEQSFYFVDEAWRIYNVYE